MPLTPSQEPPPSQPHQAVTTYSNQTMFADKTRQKKHVKKTLQQGESKHAYEALTKVDENDSEDEDEDEDLPSDVPKWIYGLSALLVIANAIFEDSYIVIALRDMEQANDSISHAAHVQGASQRYAVASLYFVYSLAFNGKPTVQGIYDMVEQVKSGVPDSDFNEGNYLSAHAKKILGAGLILFVGAYASAIDGIGCDNFVASALEDLEFSTATAKLCSVLICLLVAPTTFFTETPEMYLAISNRAHHHKKIVIDYTLLRWLSNAIGFYIRIAGGIELVIEVFVPLVALFAVTDKSTQYVLLFWSLLRAVSDYFFFGKKSAQAVDRFFKKISKASITSHEFTSFIISLTGVLFIVDAQRDLYQEFLTDPKTELPFEYGDQFVNFVIISTAIREGIVQLDALYPLVMWVLKKSTGLIGDYRNLSDPVEVTTTIQLHRSADRAPTHTLDSEAKLLDGSQNSSDPIDSELDTETEEDDVENNLAPPKQSWHTNASKLKNNCLQLFSFCNKEDESANSDTHTSREDFHYVQQDEENPPTTPSPD